jgi:hypothetical protein
MGPSMIRVQGGVWIDTANNLITSLVTAGG